MCASTIDSPLATSIHEPLHSHLNKSPHRLNTTSILRTKPDSAIMSTSFTSSSVAAGSGAASSPSPDSPSYALSSMSTKNHSMSTLPESASDQNSWLINTSHYGPNNLNGDYSPSLAFGNAMTEALAKSKGTGLIRRLSRGAHNRLRRRPSTTHTNRIRDQSAGPVLMRRRSDSTGTSDGPGEMSDLELETPSEDNVEDNSLSIASFEPANALGINGIGRRSTGSAFEGGIAPTVSALLEQGTLMTKVTKRKRKTRKFRLDASAGKVCWDASNPAKQFYIDNVREIRIGADARNSRQDIQVPVHIEGCWMTIVYDHPEGSKGRSIKTVHLIAESEYIVKLWTDALKTVERDRIEIMNALSPNPDKSARSMQLAWKQVMARKQPSDDQKIDFADARWICQKLEINCSSNTIRNHFNEADLDLVGMLNYLQYERFVKQFKTRQDIRAIYDAMKPKDEAEVDLDRFLAFLKFHQGVDVDKDRKHWEAKFDYYARGQSRGFETPPANLTPLCMNLQSFQNFMYSSANNALSSGSTDAFLDKPLNEYFISSSHNTYLMGRQVAGASSVEGYISALVKGCRCVEVDCWDGKDGRPVVNHGRTLSTEVLFEDCISIIAKYAFVSSSYPLIVSLEVHCNPEQQATMVDIMLRCFGEALLTTPLVANAAALPSPEELRGRILIKVKSTHQINDGQALELLNGSRSRSHSSPLTRPAPAESPSTSTWPMSPSSQKDGSDGSQAKAFMRANSAVSSTVNGTCVTSSGSESDVATPLLEGKKKRNKTSRIIPFLGSLGVYACGIKYTQFSAPEARLYNHIYSFAENTFNNICKNADEKLQLDKHNMQYLMRVYPAARRIDSSNFSPLSVWRRGVQMAALNWQTYDLNSQINDAMFAAGVDRTGYVLKPDELRNSRLLASPDALVDGQPAVEKNGMKFVRFSVEIVSAQRLPRPRDRNPELGINPYIEVEMYCAEDRGRGVARGDGGADASARDGSSGIGAPIRRRTKIVEGNGFDPMWKENISVTVETKYPSLIFVRWTVWNSPDGRNLFNNNAMLATFTAKLGSLQQGYRHLPLFNAYGERYRDAKLFVKIKKEPPIPLNSSMLIVEEEAHSGGEVGAAGSPRLEQAPRERSWSKRIFSRTPSQRKKSRDASPFESFSRTSSFEQGT